MRRKSEDRWCAERYNSDAGVVQGPILVGHDPLSGRVLVHEDVVHWNLNEVGTCALEAIELLLQEVRDRFEDHAFVVRLPSPGLQAAPAECLPLGHALRAYPRKEILLSSFCHEAVLEIHGIDGRGEPFQLRG